MVNKSKDSRQTSFSDRKKESASEKATGENNPEELRQYAVIVDSSPDLIALLDKKYSYLLVNRAYLYAFGKTKKEIIGNTITNVFGEDFFKKVIKQKADSCLAGNVINFHEWVDFPTLGKLYLNVSFLPYLGIDGEVKGFVTRGLDITKRKVAEDELRTYKTHLEQLVEERNAALLKKHELLKQFTYSVSHDLKEPVYKVSAFSDLLKKNYKDTLNDSAISYIEKIQKSAKRMQVLVSELLNYFKLDNLHDDAEIIDLNTLIKEIIDDLEMYIQDSNGNIHVSPLPEITGIKILIRQLFHNIISNGLKYRKSDVCPNLFIYDISNNPGLHEIVVEDNGIGFNEKHSEAIFQPFQRLNLDEKVRGSGLGLHICQQITERHGGAINVTSVFGQGSKFIVSLPKEIPCDEGYSPSTLKNRSSR